MELKELSDEEVFIKSADEPDFFGEIIERYEKKLDNFLKKISNLNDDERKDLLQEIFISAYQKIYSFEKDQNFSAWIYRIARNKNIDYWRKNKKRMNQISIENNLSFVESFFWKNEIIDEIEKKEEEDILKKLFQKLPLKYKEIYILRFEENKSYEEISEILKIPKPSVGTLIYRLKNILKKEYKKFKK